MAYDQAMAKKKEKNILIKNNINKKMLIKKIFYRPWPATRPWEKKEKNIINKKF